MQFNSLQWTIPVVLVAVMIVLSGGTFTDTYAMTQEDLRRTPFDENACKDNVRANTSLTFAEKPSYQKKNCENLSRAVFSDMMEKTPYSTIQIF